MINRMTNIVLVLCFCVLLSSCNGNYDSGKKSTDTISQTEAQSVVDAETKSNPDTVETELETAEEIKVSVFVSSADLNVRAGAGTSYDVITSVKSGDKLLLTGNEMSTSSGSKWLEVELPELNKTGWVSAKYGTIEVNGKGVTIGDSGSNKEKISALLEQKREISGLEEQNTEKITIGNVVFIKPTYFDQEPEKWTFCPSVLEYYVTLMFAEIETGILDDSAFKKVSDKVEKDILERNKGANAEKTVKTKVAGYDAYLTHYNFIENKEIVTSGYVCCINNTDRGTVISIVCGYDSIDESNYDYEGDFVKMLKKATAIEGKTDGNKKYTDNEVKEIIDSVIKESVTSGKYSVSMEGTLINVMFYPEGITLLAYEASELKDKDAQKSWNKAVSDVKSLSEDLSKLVNDELNRSDLYVALYYCHDMGADNALLVVMNGVVFYDYVNNIDFLF